MIKLIIFLGIFINFAAYENFYSLLIFFFVFCLARLTSNFFSVKDRNTEKDLSLWICSIIFFLSGFIELLIVNFGSQYVVGPDATRFFLYASDPSWSITSFISENISGYANSEALGLKEDFLPILIWNKLYIFFNNLSIPSGRYIGIAINTIFLVWTSFFGLSILRSIKKLNNIRSENFYKFLFCANGIFWMYGAIHLREALMLLIITVLLKVWIDWIHTKSFFNLIKLGIICISYYLIADFIRGGYSIILVVFFTAYILTIIYQAIRDKKFNLIVFLMIPILTLIILFSLKNDVFSSIFFSINERFETYNLISEETSDIDSIGIVLLKLPFFFRIFFSVFYLLFMPIPIWSIIENNIFSSYHFFKSSYAIYNYLTLPFFIIVLGDSIKYFKRIDKTKLFLILLYIFTSFAIGITSLESRHYGNFSIIYILLLCFFNWDIEVLRVQYKKVLSYLLFLIFILYFIYVFIKFQSIYLLLIFISIPLILKLFIKKEKEKI